jgi:PAS domain S-box-containing protein
MHAENFFISLFDPAKGNIYFPYFVDQCDPQPLPRPLGRGLTEYVLRTGEPLFANPTRFADMVITGEAETMGAPSVDWLGVPLKIMDRTIGVMAVQSYTEGIRFNQQDLEILTFVSTQAAMAIERKQSDEALRFSEQLYHTTIDSLSELIHVVDRSGRILMQNQALRNRNLRLGMPLETIGKSLPEAFPYLGASILDTYEIVFQTGAGESYVSERTISGEHFIYDTDVVPIIEAGHVEWAITVLHDITDQKLAEQRLKDALAEKEVLLREIHHRVKNNLQVITSLLGLQADYIKDPHTLEVFQETQARMRSMALIHEELYQSVDLAHINYPEYIQKLTSNLFHAFSLNPNIHLELNLADVYLGIETAIPCGLIINELVTNALKYAFPYDRSGVISLRLTCADTPFGICYTLIVADDGVGIPDSIDFKNTQSLGLQLVNILVSQIKGKIELDTTHGSRFVIEFRDKSAL